MGTIVQRRRSNGSIGYTAQIRLKRDGALVHTEAQTFGKKALATEWLRRRESELDQQRARGEPLGVRHTLKELIDWYIAEVKASANWGRTKEADLNRLRGYPIAAKRAANLSVADYLQHAAERRSEGAGPATVGNDFIWIGQILKSARSALGIPVDLTKLDDARHELRSRKVIQKSKQRDRRVSAAEEAKLLEHFRARDGRADIPMADIVQFALASARRQEEITRLRRHDLVPEKGIAWLDDVKHPRQKIGNRRSFRMPPAAWEIIHRQPAGNDLVFPYNPKSIGAAFTRACKLLGIKDLRFHDLRHEATSRLFERGHSIQEVAQFTLHESWATLKRYTHLKPEDVPDR